MTSERSVLRRTLGLWGVTGLFGVCLSLSESLLVAALYRNQDHPPPFSFFVLGPLSTYLAIGLVVALLVVIVQQALPKRSPTVVLFLTIAAVLFVGYFLSFWLKVFSGGLGSLKAIASSFLLLGLSALLASPLLFMKARVDRGRRLSGRLVLFGALFAAGALLSLIHRQRIEDPRRITDPRPTATVASPVIETSTIVIVSFDALRADHLGLYGYPRSTSPELDSFLRDSMIFQNAIAPKSKTGPSLASLLTGLYPLRHGALRHGWDLHPSTDTLPALLPAEFRSAAFLGNSVPDIYVSKAGFDHTALFRGKASSPRILSAAREWLENQTGSPVFLWVHLLEPHTPYSPPEEDLSIFLEDAWYDVAEYSPYSLEAAAKHFGIDLQDELAESTVREMVNRTAASYDAYIRFATRNAADFARRVRGIRPDAVFIVTADHGESMVEHDFFFWHGEFASQPVIHVPLVLSVPGLVSPRRIATPVSLVDVAPTVCALAACNEVPAFDGISLFEVAANGIENRQVFSSALDNPLYGSWAIVEESRKLIATPLRLFLPLDAIAELRFRLLDVLLGRPRLANPYRFRVLKTQLYDLASDPHELTDLSQEKPQEAARLQANLLEWLDFQFLDARLRQTLEHQSLSPETVERMKALGYLN